MNSDLFGHTRGAFTGAADERKGLLAEAENGTLFLDEVDELPLDAQVTLLGVLHDRVYRMVGSNQERRADFRLISASNQRIEQCVETGKVRRDLFHRIAHLRIDLPPLRERLDDIEDLVRCIMRRLHEREGLPVLSAAPELFDRLRSYEWPGNVRELEAVVEGAAYRARYEGRDRIISEDLSLAHRDDSPCRSTRRFHLQVREFQRKLVAAALARHGGNQLRAAEELGIDRGTVRRMAAPREPTVSEAGHEPSSQSAQ